MIMKQLLAFQALTLEIFYIELLLASFDWFQGIYVPKEDEGWVFATSNFYCSIADIIIKSILNNK